MRKLIVLTVAAVVGILAPAGIVAADTIEVEEGDTVSEHAEENGVSWQEMGECSGLANPHLIFPGDLLVVPDTGDDCVEVPREDSPAPTPTTSPEPEPEPEPTTTNSSSSYGKWDPIIACESGGDWDYNGSSGFDGGLQFHPDTWRGFGGEQYAPYAYQAEPWQQIEIAERVLAGQGWRAWPTCSAQAGYR